MAGYLIAGLALIGVFVLIERRQPEPMLPLSIFRVPTMAASLLASLFQGLASFAVLFLLIMYLQAPRGLSPIHASLLLVPGYVLGAVSGPYAGRLADRRSPVLPATAGPAIQVVALAIYAQLSNETGLWVVVLASVINGIGAGAPRLGPVGADGQGCSGHLSLGDRLSILRRRHSSPRKPFLPS